MKHTCDICYSSSVKVIGKADFFSQSSEVLKCSECGNIIKLYNPVLEEVIEFYQNCPHDPPKLYKNKIKKQKKFLELNINTGKINSVLEVGSGPIGMFSVFPKEIKKYSLEIDKKASKKLEKLGVKNYLKWEQIDRKFDLIILSHVVEHVLEDIPEYVKRLMSYLNEGGIIFIEVPTSKYELMISDNEIINHNFTKSHKRSLSEDTFVKLFSRLNIGHYRIRTLDDGINRLEYKLRFNYVKLITPFIKDRNAKKYMIYKYISFTCYLFGSAILSSVIKLFNIPKPSLDILISNSPKNFSSK